MKLKSWMEAHIVLHTKWKKKEKRKKSSDKSKNQPVRDSTSASLPSWRTSNFLQFFVTGNSAATKQSKTLPESREKDCKSQRPPHSLIPEDVATSTANSNTQTPKCGHEGHNGIGSIHALHVHLADQLDGVSLNSPRQRNKIRTNPWLTPKQQQRSFPSSGTSSDCNSGSWDPWRNSSLSRNTAESSRDSYPLGCALQVAAKSPLPQPPLPGKKLPGKAEDSDSEECETLNEMGNFDEHYEYEWETAESDILGDESDGRRHRPSKRRGRPPHVLTAAPQLKWRDLRSDEDYSEKLDYADEAYSEMSSSSTEGRGGGFSDIEEKVGRGSSPEADSAFPSESEMSSTATTPLMEGTGAGSSSGSDSGIQPHSGWSESGRTLHGIRDSLEDKVRHLRFERLVVEDRIREAKEEEEQRKVEKERFRKELVSHRRLVLLRTLDELRLKLEDHGARLQEAYHSTLEMQMSCRRQLATVVEENQPATVTRMPTTHEKLL